VECVDAPRVQAAERHRVLVLRVPGRGGAPTAPA